MQSHAWTRIRESAESLIFFGDLVFRDAEFGWGMCRDVVLGLRKGIIWEGLTIGFGHC